MTDFGKRLKSLREAAGLSQKQLAEASGLSQQAIGHWETGIREPTWANVAALCTALGVSCEAFRADGTPSSPANEKAKTDEPKKPARRKKGDAG